MTVIHAVWLSSAFGALLFFICGYMAARMRIKPPMLSTQPSEAIDPVRVKLEQEVASLQNAARAAKDHEKEQHRKIAALERTKNTAEVESTRLAAEAESLKKQLADAVQTHTELQKIKNNLEAQQAAAEQSREHANALATKLKTAEATRKEIQLRLTKLEKEHAEQQAIIQQKEQSYRQLLEERKELAAKLETVIKNSAITSSATAEGAQLRKDYEAIQVKFDKLQRELQASQTELQQRIRQTGEQQKEQNRLRQDLQKATHDLQRAHQQNAELEKANQALRKHEEEIQGIRYAAEKENEATVILKQQLDIVTERLRITEARLEQSDKLKNERQALSKKVAELEQELRKRLAEKELALAESSDAVSKAQRATNEAEQQVIPSELVLLADKTKALEELEKELQWAKEENASLKILVAESDAVRNQLEIMSAELMMLKNLVQRESDAFLPNSRPISSQAVMKLGSLHSILEKAINHQNTSCIVLADPMGLLIEGAGKEMEEVAAIAAHLTEATTKTIHLLPFGELQRISFEDENATTITIFPVTTQDSGKLILGTFSNGPGPDRKALLAAIDTYTG